MSEHNNLPITLPIMGGCICGAVRYSISAPPMVVRQCWCRDCQYWGSGSATVNAVFEVAHVSLTGALTHFTSKAASGNTMRRGFCPACGTPVTSASDARPQFVILRVGTLDQPSIAAPVMAIWTDSAPDWAHIDPDLPTTPLAPPPLPQGSR